MNRSDQIAPRPRRACRVLAIDQAGEAGGAQYCLLDFLDGSAPDDVTTLLLTDGSFRARIEERGIPVVAARSGGRFVTVPRGSGPLGMLAGVGDMLRLAKQAARLARDHDVIYANTQKALLIGAMAAKIAQRPLVWHLHDILTVGDTSGAVQQLARRVANACCDRVIVNSIATRESFASVGGRAPTILVYNGIDAARFDPGRHAQARPAGIAADKPLAGVFSRLSEWKGQHVAIRAVAAIPDLQLMLVGGPLFGQQAYEASLRQLAAELGLSDRVFFLGDQPDVAGLMQQCDVVVHSSTLPEPFGRVVVEGMLSGRPVIATDAGGVREIIEDGKTGLLVPPGDTPALADALRGLLASPSLAAALSAAAYPSAVERFDARRYARDVWQVLEAAGRPPLRAAGKLAKVSASA